MALPKTLCRDLYLYHNIPLLPQRYTHKLEQNRFEEELISPLIVRYQLSIPLGTLRYGSSGPRGEVLTLYSHV